MKDRRKKILAIVLIALVLLLGVAAVFVTIQLQRAAVPTAPVSKPRAAEWLGGGNCNVSFTVAALTPTATVTTTVTATATVTPAPSCRNTCTTEGTVSGNFKCQGGMWHNKDCATTDNTNCECPGVTTTVTTTVTATATATATVTPAPAVCSQACPTQEGVIEGSYKCQGGMWRNKNCATSDDDACVCPTVTTTIVVSRTPAPTRVATATATAAPTGAQLPETGILNLPGAAAFGGGLLLTILGILFAL